MSAKKSGRRNAVILLVVLGMLSLLSLLAVTFVVSSSQSRMGSLAMAGRDFRGTPPDRLLDQALRQVLRGTTDARSAAWKNDLLGDLYGSQVFDPGVTTAQDAPVFLTARTSTGGIVARDNPERVKAFNYYVDPPLNTFNAISPEAPEFYPSNTNPNFLKIPLTWPDDKNSTIVQKLLPEQSDAWNGRVVTFMEGPLANQSFRIVRYVGEVDLVLDSNNKYKLNPQRANLQYSITIDLADVKDNLATLKSSSGVWQTKTVSEWSQSGAAALLYEDYLTLSSPYRMMINAGVLNSYGAGYDLGGTPTKASFGSTTVFNTVPDSYLPHHSPKGISTISGDTDEPYDAADYQNFFMALKQAPASGTPDSDDIIPSFHRPAVINYLATQAPKLNDTSLTYTDPQVIQLFKDFLSAVQRATARPLSYNIKGLGLSSNPQFSGSNSLDFRAAAGARAPQLSIDWSKLPNQGEQDKFEAWIRWLTRGPWDVDNDSEGIRDSVWVDLNFPLMTSPEGKLLKTLVAFYIEDMDGKLDINAAGGWDTTPAANMGSGASLNKYAYANTNSAAIGTWPQGLGYGPAEISLRPALTSDAEYTQLLTNRYSSSDTTDDQPGIAKQNEGHSLLLERNRADEPTNYGLLPGGFSKSPFPLAVRGRSGLGLDLLGNPILVETFKFGETDDDPYDARVLFHNHFDRNFSVAEYQRLVRFNDLDRSGAPRRMQIAASSAFTPTFANSVAYLNRIRSISPRNVVLTLPRFAVNYQYPRVDTGTMKLATRRVASFVEFVEAYAQNKPLSATSPLSSTPPTPYFNSMALSRLFPIEFMQNRPLNLNRPLGNGQNDDIDGVIDEADELATGQAAVYQTVGSSNPAKLSFNEEYVRDPVGYDAELEKEAAAVQNSWSGNQPKQLLARHLYCLAQLILPAEYRFPNQPDPTTVVTPADRARILAQWAVNVIDFRDADSAMTRFAYDATPFVAKTGGVYWVPADGVVWGVEQPELVITETLAFHDMRIRKKPGSNPTQYEQLRVPQGSLFMEFLCPKTQPIPASGTFDATLPPAMYGLYKLNNGVPVLDLGAFVQDSAGNKFPKWRVAFLKPQQDGASGFKDALSKVYEDTTAAKRFDYTYQIGNSTAGLKWYTGTGTADPAEPKIDRVMWFANIDPTASNHGLPSAITNPEDRIFRWTAGTTVGGTPSTPLLGGGQYLAVGPRMITYLGSKKDTNGNPHHTPSNHRIQLTNNWIQIWNQDNDPALWPSAYTSAPLVKNNQATTAPNAPFNTKIRDVVTMTAGMRVPADWDADAEITEKWIGLNVSEPSRTNYYDKPTAYLNSTDTTNPADPDNNAPAFKNMSKDAYIDLSNPGSGPAPFDVGAKSYLTSDPTAKWSGTDYPDIQTQKNWTAAVLQRLADPLRPYHEKYNPYITVDWMPIDLTVFSGEETLPANADIFLASRQKTGATLLPNQKFDKAGDAASTSPLAGTTFYSYHNEVTTTKSATASATTPVYFDYQLETEYYAKTGATAQARSGISMFATFGYLNPRFVIRGTWNLPAQTPPVVNNDDYEHAYFVGAPGPNPWATQKAGVIATASASSALKVPLAPYFPNRDFVNALELTSVPLSSPGQFFQEFSAQATNASIPKFPFTLDFEDLYLATSPPKPPAPGQARSTAILFDCVSVPSPWGDSWKVVNPESTRGYFPPNTPKQLSQMMLFENYRAPYNVIPTFLRPGLVNLNTATEGTVFHGLMWNMMTPASNRLTAGSIPYMSTLMMERQGYAGPASPIGNGNPHLNNSYPTEFTKPFTSSLIPDKFADPTLQSYASTDVGLLRHKSGTSVRIFDAGESGVFPDDGTRSTKPPSWLYSTAIPLNSYTHNYPAARMANLTTDRSNVFAIRMTLGQFEYDVTTGSIGAEYGSEQGKAKRHRAYYLIDRSVPVGYRTGQDLNADNCVLFRSIVE